MPHKRKVPRKHWEYERVHPYSFDSKEAWCNLPMALLISGIVVFGVILFAAVIIDHDDHHEDEDEDFHSGKDAPSIINNYARAIDRLQRDVETKESQLECPTGTHGWHPKGTLQKPTCRVNYPWPHAVDQELLSVSGKGERDPCVDFEAYVCNGWHQSSGKGVGSLRGVPASRGFSELGYRNALLRGHVSLSDAELLDDGSDNRALLHTLVSSCTNSLSGALFKDLGELSNRLKQLTRKRNSEPLGFLFGRAQCQGASPILHVTPGVDMTDKRRKVLYVEPMGVLGTRSVSLDSDAKKYMKKHVAMITLACQVLDEVKFSGGNTCVPDTLRLEDALVWDRKASGEEVSSPEKEEEALPVIMTRSAPKTPTFFSSEWWDSYERGLVDGGCVSPDADLGESGLWTHDTGYLNNLLSVEATDKDWVRFLRVSIVLDYLEHSNVARLESFLSSSSSFRGERGDEARLTFGARPESHPAKSASPHTRGYYTAANGQGHFGPSRKYESKALTGMIDAFLHHRQRGHANHERSAWERAHYVDVDSVEPDREAFWGVCSEVAGIYLPGIKDNTFAASITTQKERDRIRTMTRSIVDAIVASIQESHLLTDKAKRKLTGKARAIAVRVAVPWTTEPEYQASLDIEGKSFYADSVRVRSWHMRNAFDEVFSSSEEEEEAGEELYHFGMSTSEVNAYYAPEENSINILAGILGAPFYDNRYTNASLYATIGAVIGHELCHGFDSVGVKFDPEGSYRSWLDEQDVRAYEAREQCFIDEYTVTTRLGNTNDGQHSLTENIADTMGLRAALRAFLATSPRITDMKHTLREFVEAYGQVWCVNQSPVQEAAQIERDVHSPGGVRINGAVRNLRMSNGKSPLEVAYGCPADAPMLRDEACTLW